MIIYYLRIIILFIMGSMISPTEAAVSCTSTSPQCCWVIRSWQLMGKTTSVSSTSKTACCNYLGSTPQTSGIPRVNCFSTGTIAKIHWTSQNLSGPIPSELGKLVNLLELYLDNNQLTGPIPAAIGKLTNLWALLLQKNSLTGPIPAAFGNGDFKYLWGIFVYNNVGISGLFTPNCRTKVYASNTSLTICGCSSTASPPVQFPPPGTPDECLATGPATALQKRVEIFSQNIGSYRYTCNVDGNRNPHADCLNTQAKICNTTYMGTDPTRLSDCKTGVNQMAQGMSPWWQAVRKECGQWAWNGFTGNVASSNCASANSKLAQNAYYIGPDGSRTYVTSALTNSVNAGLWNNANLKG